MSELRNGIGIVLAFGVAACGGGREGGTGAQPPGPGTDPVDVADGSVEPVTDLDGSYRYLGFVELIQDDVEDTVDRDSTFLRMTTAQPAAVFRDSVPMRVDTCSLSVTRSITADAGTIGFPDASFELVSAGDGYTFTGEAGTYATVTTTDSRFDIAAYPAPSPLTLDIPGAEFPAFSDVPMPELAAVGDLRPRGDDVLSADSTISWTPTGLAEHTLNLFAFDISTPGSVVELRCRVADDGEFGLPDDVVEALDASLGGGFEITGLQALSRADALIVEGDALLVVRRSLR